jgi:hypothetical protein
MVQSANPSPRERPPVVPFVFDKWEEDSVQTVFGVALDVSGPLSHHHARTSANFNHVMLRACYSGMSPREED